MTRSAPEFRLTVPVGALASFAALCHAAGWAWNDTGERITSDDGWDAEAVVAVAVPALVKTPDGGALVAVSL